MSKQTLFSRIVLMVICACVAGACFWQLNQSYDPLARYPYATEKNRETILKYLDSQEIDYMISQHLRPKYYMDFIRMKDFDIHKTMEYYTAKKSSDESDAYIVNFVNKYDQYFSNDDLENLLDHYSFMDLTAFYENDKINNHALQLAADPSAPFLILDAYTTVYKYSPAQIKSFHGIKMQSVMISDLKDMQQMYSSMMVNDSLRMESGYKSYDECAQYYGELENIYPKKQLKRFVLPAGQNEYQLGYTIALEGNNAWMAACLQNITNGEIDYDVVMNTLSDSQKNQLIWLEENAYHFGFIIRYPNETRDTQMAYQPFVLRYVGKQAAKAMHSSNKTMENTDFSDMEMQEDEQ